MDTNEFIRLVAEGDEYRTSADLKRTLANRLFGGWDLYFHLRLALTINRASRKAARGQFDCLEWQRTGLALTVVCEECGGTLLVEGLRHARAVQKPCVIVANHMSMQETFAIPAFYLGRCDVATVVKRGLMTYPVFGRVMRSIAPIVVDRANAREDFRTVMAEGCRALEQGRCVMVFPQSTRSQRFEPEHFNSMGAKLAARAKVPLQPVAVRTDHIDNGRLIKDFGPAHLERPICFSVAPALDYAVGAREMHKLSVMFIEQKMREWGVPVGPPQGETDQYE